MTAASKSGHFAWGLAAGKTLASGGAALVADGFQARSHAIARREITRSNTTLHSELPNQHRRREAVHVEVLLLGEEREVVGPRPPVVQVPF